MQHCRIRYRNPDLSNTRHSELDVEKWTKKDESSRDWITVPQYTVRIMYRDTEIQSVKSSEALVVLTSATWLAIFGTLVKNAPAVADRILSEMPGLMVFLILD